MYTLHRALWEEESPGGAGACAHKRGWFFITLAAGQQPGDLHTNKQETQGRLGEREHTRGHVVNAILGAAEKKKRQTVNNKRAGV